MRDSRGTGLFGRVFSEVVLDGSVEGRLERLQDQNRGFLVCFVFKGREVQTKVGPKEKRLWSFLMVLGHAEMVAEEAMEDTLSRSSGGERAPEGVGIALDFWVFGATVKMANHGV